MGNERRDVTILGNTFHRYHSFDMWYPFDPIMRYSTRTYDIAQIGPDEWYLLPTECYIRINDSPRKRREVLEETKKDHDCPGPFKSLEEAIVYYILQT